MPQFIKTCYAYLMEQNITDSVLQDFARFIERLNCRGESMTAEEATQAYRKQEKQLFQFRQEIQPALEQLEENLGTNLDIGKIITDGRKILAGEGITD